MRVLVTGGRGFLGRRIVELLLEEPEVAEVRSFARGSDDELAASGVEQVRGDLADAERVARATEGVDSVFHVAAKTGSWGSARSFLEANVRGTENVVAACRRHGVSCLIHTSTPSVVLDGSDLDHADESLPLASRFHACYPETKAEAERVVVAATSPTLRAVILRPHLIWGPRDTNLVPRILERARSGRLRRFSGPAKWITPTYIDDAAAAHLCAWRTLAGPRGREVSGEAFFVTSGERIPTWEMVDRLLVAMGEPPCSRRIPPRLAYGLGAVLEALWSVLRVSGEPPMTRWVAEELGSTHCFAIDRAREALGYSPAVSIEEGLERLSSWHRARDSGSGECAA